MHFKNSYFKGIYIFTLKEIYAFSNLASFTKWYEQQVDVFPKEHTPTKTNPKGKANLQFGDYSFYKNCENKDASCAIDGKSPNSRKYCNIWILVVECLEQSSPKNCQNDLLSAAGVLKLNSRFLFSKRSSFKLHLIHESFQPLVSIVVVVLNFVRFQQRVLSV